MTKIFNTAYKEKGITGDLAHNSIIEALKMDDGWGCAKVT